MRAGAVGKLRGAVQGHDVALVAAVPLVGVRVGGGCAAGGEVVDVGVGDPAGAEPDGQAGPGVDDEPDAGVVGVAGDLVGQRAAVAGPVAQRHVDVGGGGDPEADA